MKTGQARRVEIRAEIDALLLEYLHSYADEEGEGGEGGGDPSYAEATPLVWAMVVETIWPGGDIGRRGSFRLGREGSSGYTILGLLTAHARDLSEDLIP